MLIKLHVRSPEIRFILIVNVFYDTLHRCQTPHKNEAIAVPKTVTLHEKTLRVEDAIMVTSPTEFEPLSSPTEADEPA